MTARECDPTANNERAPVRNLDLCLTPFGAFLRSFCTGTHDLRIQIQPPNQGSVSPIAPATPSIPTPAASQIPFETHSRECASGFVQTALSKLPPAITNNRNPDTVAPGQPR